MGKEFTAKFSDGSERFAASMAMGRAALFYDIAVLLERYVGQSCGISVDNGMDEHEIDPDVFIAFFELVWKAGWIAEADGFIAGWASHAAGMIENITLEPRTWIDRDGVELKVARYLRNDELGISGS
ncbi:MAG: hypothetical protein R2747_15840 [Pyrinomonadaceae bacterium]